jgi:hypothetical protein
MSVLPDLLQHIYMQLTQLSVSKTYRGMSAESQTTLIRRDVRYQVTEHQTQNDNSNNYAHNTGGIVESDILCGSSPIMRSFNNRIMLEAVFSAVCPPRLYHSTSWGVVGCEMDVSQQGLELWNIGALELQRGKPLPDKRWRHGRLRRLIACHNELQYVWITSNATVTCSYDLYVINKHNYQSKPYLQSLNHVTIF